ncbi:hypothetical protein BGZ76_004207 [Entomortierella beljakovae]|nr:hypothetical protein BGZ76_004207 [Entomortierella beljakovae]
MSSDSFTLDIATPTKALTSPSSIVTTQPADDDASDSNGLVDFQKSGGYIYIILFVAFTIAMVYFIKVALAKRKVKMQLEKEYDNEVPPGYDGHIFRYESLQS